jgi:hypothetical protein
MAFGPGHMWARVGAARAERAGGRSVARSGAGKRARRSGAQPGLDDVGKLPPRYAWACPDAPALIRGTYLREYLHGYAEGVS